jgi:hypothetical protein
MIVHSPFIKFFPIYLCYLSESNLSFLQLILEHACYINSNSWSTFQKSAHTGVTLTLTNNTECSFALTIFAAHPVKYKLCSPTQHRFCLQPL